MRRVLTFACACSLGVLAFAADMELVPSTPIPKPGGEITLQVTGAPGGAQFSWDFDGDGRPDVSTTQPTARWTVPAGYWEVTVDVRQGGRSVGRVSAAVVAHADVGAVRSVQWIAGVAEVTVIVRAKQTLAAPGLAETIPPGWVLGTVEGPDLFTAQGGTLYVLWSTILDPGAEVRLRYRLHPPAPGMAARLLGTVSGYQDGDRVEARVAGRVTF